ncbi:hypothetical protein A3D00_03215 [Candidatus Woesebacteria bacterium RIFCSPHIGHO2_02_FULL_38_9]|uniref:Glycosyltransferase RgtA/B/C/D-like domain-containing protein n=1 Tax=Candidatus Woesebacteria bacterium RIFCSPHIGHO2_01_FULL_39_28 TaxID=1802496 RepID=A0A1F7YHP4_9BACT|nr:MAG: hypothetical protein A2627_05660 [Candidatus Woesebacteria bacterium RIFCSPHIGHO2_01_FULL_39_28]OGM31478.1 MAG: hypothetical protein A3D00_03215 [Candidatus Woesebacteria bacterium RIFCSPHIGHO2_02_FULL_38_9]OGM56664.1 MAG: hypothetical protein A3A50_04855 [Candidatus Woesebacteria bacterium RIFCSPLOWO2_01_FULL_38_20]
MDTKKTSRITFLVFPTLFFFLVIFVSNFLLPVGEQHNSLLARSFLDGKLFFINEPLHKWIDTAFFGNHHYWPLGPFPTVILMLPVFLFSFFGKFFYQGYLQFFIVLAVFILVYKISQKLKYSNSDSFFLTFGFSFSSAFLGVSILSWSWWFTQVVTTLLLFLAIHEYLNKKRYLLIGTIFGFIAATRLSALPPVAFFFLEILLGSKKLFTSKLKSFFFLFIPILISLMLLAGYNYQRFGNIFEQGYNYQILLTESLSKAREYGIFSLAHLPTNLYYFLLSVPLPIFRDGVSHVLKFPFVMADPWGMSIFITSPYFIYLFFLKYKDKISKLFLVSIFLTALPILLYYGVGFRQFGYRYSLDFLPFLFWLLIRNYNSKYKKLSNKFKILVLISAFTNLYLFRTLF